VSRRFKRWQLVVVVLVAFVLLRNVSTELPSWSWILAIPVVVVLIFASKRLQKGYQIKSAASQLDALRDEVQHLRETLEFFENHESQFDESMPNGIVAKKDEHVIGVVSEVELVESKTTPSKFRGGSTGASFRLTNRLSVRQSGFRGRSIPGEEVPAVIDTGQFVITDQRGVFLGSQQNREFQWDNLLAYELKDITSGSSILYLPVSNRQKTSGLAADTAPMRQVHQRVAFGVAVAMSRKDQFIERLRKDIAEAEAELAARQTGSIIPPNL
jgi:Sec-independent protein translocase protein TatA